jgi:hypothetical protein
MPRNDEPRSKKKSPQVDAPSKKVGQTISLPRPTQDQQAYLEEIKRATGHYDPTVIVGGPRRTAI